MTNLRLPSFIRRDVKRAIEDALHPRGMSTHDGKARIGVDRLQYLLRLIDGTQDDPVECSAEPWLLDTDAKVEWANKRVLFGRTWRLGDHCTHRPAHEPTREPLPTCAERVSDLRLTEIQRSFIMALDKGDPNYMVSLEWNEGLSILNELKFKRVTENRGAE